MNRYTENLKPKTLFYIFSLLFLISFSGCNGCDKDSNPVSPGEGNPFAVQVISANIGCEGINLYTNPEAALWGPDWNYLPDGRYSGFVSLGPAGDIVIKMGVDVVDGPGPDIAVYQAVSDEETGVYVTDNLSTPFQFLGSERCGYLCRFDLNGSGFQKVRYVMVKDMGDSDCYETAGADIDAVEALNYK
ncbi:MAG: hypothetical protein AABY44_08510 [Nitrospirota bacterium]